MKTNYHTHTTRGYAEDDARRKQRKVSPKYNVSNHLRPYVPVQVTHQQIPPHHQLLTESGGGKMHVQHLVLNIKFAR